MAPPPSGPGGSLSAFLEEASIRWLLLLGGLLLASAGVGLLYSQWNAHGKQLVALAMLGAPILCLAAAMRLRPSLPLSSRILAVVGGLLLPTGLAAARLFELGGLRVPWAPWNLVAFLSSAGVLLALAALMGDASCLYLGTLGLTAAAAALAAWTSHPPAFGLGCLGVGAAWLAASRSGSPRLAPFRPHLFALSQAVAGLGLLSTLPSFFRPAEGPPLGDLSLLLLGATFLVGSSLLARTRGSLFWSAPAALAALLLYGLSGRLPYLDLGYALVALSGMYLASGRVLRDREGMEGVAETSFQVGTLVMGLPLAALLLGPVFQGLADNFSSAPAGQLRTAMLVALAASALYTAGAATWNAPRLVYASTASLAYAWFLGTVLLHRPLPGLYGIDLSLLPLAWVALAWILRRALPSRFLDPLVTSALLLSLVPGPLNLALKALSLPAAAQWAPLTLLVTTLTILLSTPWTRSGSLLYLASAWGSLAYSLGLPLLLAALGLPAQPLNQALAFLPLLLALAWAALLLQPRAGQTYALPVARATLLLAVGLALGQLDPSLPNRHLAALALALYALGLAALARPFRDWTLLGASCQDVLAHLAALAVPASLWVAAGDGTPSSHSALLAFALAGLLVAEVPALPSSGTRALAHAALAVGLVVALWGPPSAHRVLLQAAFATGPALLWLARASRREDPDRLVAGSGLLAACGALAQSWAQGPALGHSGPGLVGLATLTRGYGLAGYRERPRGALVLAWLSAAATWDGALFLAHLSPDARVRLWSLFWLLLCACVAERNGRRPEAGRLLEACAQVSALVLLGRAVPASASTLLQVDLVLAGVLLCTGWRRPQAGYFVLGWALLAGAPLLAERVLPGTLLLGRAGAWMGGLVALAPLLARLPGSGPLRALLAPLARATALAACLLALAERDPQASLAGLAANALALWLQALLKPSRLDWHLGFLAAYAAYGLQLDRAHLHTAELWTVPPALWLLFWGERYRLEGAGQVSKALAGVGAFLLLGPSLVATLTASAPGHLFFLVAAALALLLAGLGRRHKIHASAGSLALLAEVLFQALRLATRIPWWYVALAAGLCLVGLGILFERRRMALLRAGQDLLQRFSGW